MFVSVATRRVFAVCCLAAAAVAAAPASAASKPAETYIAGVLVEANAVFAKPAEADRRAGIDALVAKHVDLDRTGMFVLGQYARVMTPAQKAEYQPLFRRFAARVYQNTLAGYKGEKLVVTGSTERSPTDVIVNSRFAAAAPSSANAKTVVMWRVLTVQGGAMKVVDAGADNVWLAVQQQDQFKSIIANAGGGTKGVDALIADLKRQLAQP